MWSVARAFKTPLKIAPQEATAERRGFAVHGLELRNRLDRIGATFISGYHAALEQRSIEELELVLDCVDAEWRGFAYEGAAMALTLLDYLTPWKRNRLTSFLQGPASPHKYMVHVGAGWALARLPVSIERSLGRMDPLIGWLAVDGFGFHEGYFHWKKYINGNTPNKRVSGYAARVFDQGFGRSLWFVEGADVSRIAEVIDRFSPARRADLWSGVGLACSYAGGLHREDLQLLRTSAGPYTACLAQGAAFAAKARERAGNPAAHTELACQMLCNLSAAEAALVTDRALPNLPSGPHVPAYELWRQRIASIFMEEGVCKT